MRKFAQWAINLPVRAGRFAWRIAKAVCEPVFAVAETGCKKVSAALNEVERARSALDQFKRSVGDLVAALIGAVVVALVASMLGMLVLMLVLGGLFFISAAVAWAATQVGNNCKEPCHVFG